MAEPLSTCALCPRLCRHACPVATGTAREAAVPTQLASVVLGWERGEVDAELARQAATLCVDCGACQDACHLHRPLPDLLGEARAQLLEGTVRSVPGWPAIQGVAEEVVVELGDRRWGDALSKRVGRPLATWRPPPVLVQDLRGTPAWPDARRQLARLFRGRVAVVAHGGAARTLGACDIEVAWAHELVGIDAVTSCACGGPAHLCCGAAPPLVDHHPEDAGRMAGDYPLDPGARLADARCRDHLARHGRAVPDAVDALMEAP